MVNNEACTKIAKKLHSSCFVTFLWLSTSSKNDENVVSKSNKQKKLSKKILVAIWKVTDEK